MQFRVFSSALVATVFSLATGLATAADAPVSTPKAAASQVKSDTKVDKNAAPIAAKRKTMAKVKLVDINTASAAGLKKLPGITDVEAAKIIAGRPYGSKAWLVSNNIIDGVTYANIRDLIIAKQPSKDAAKNAALYKAKK